MSDTDFNKDDAKTALRVLKSYGLRRAKDFYRKAKSCVKDKESLRKGAFKAMNAANKLSKKASAKLENKMDDLAAAEAKGKVKVLPAKGVGVFLDFKDNTEVYERANDLLQDGQYKLNGVSKPGKGLVILRFDAHTLGNTPCYIALAHKKAFVAKEDDDATEWMLADIFNSGSCVTGHNVDLLDLADVDVSLDKLKEEPLYLVKGQNK